MDNEEVDHGNTRKSTEREEEMEVYENPPRYTAKEIEDGLYSGMDPDVELVPAQYYDQMRADRDRAVGALERAGFVDHGAEAWKPPLGWGDTGQQRERLIALEDERAELQRRLREVVAMLEPGEKPNCMHPKYNPSKMLRLTEYNLDCKWYEMRKQSHARAVAIAEGRTP